MQPAKLFLDHKLLCCEAHPYMLLCCKVHPYSFTLPCDQRGAHPLRYVLLPRISEHCSRFRLRTSHAKVTLRVARDACTGTSPLQ